jgi:hypothetical protein
MTYSANGIAIPMTAARGMMDVSETRSTATATATMAGVDADGPLTGLNEAHGAATADGDDAAETATITELGGEDAQDRVLARRMDGTDLAMTAGGIAATATTDVTVGLATVRDLTPRVTNPRRLLRMSATSALCLSSSLLPVFALNN